MNKTYTIELNGIILGTSLLEKADPSMGVVFGEIIIQNSQIDYLFLKSFCENNGIELASDYPKDKLLSTTTIDSLKVTNSDGIVIEGIGNQISGMDGEGFEISLEGIPYPFYEEEFPHHVRESENKFK